MTSNPQNSRQWDLGRFFKTLSYFGAVPFLSSLDWFQQWLGSRTEPTLDQAILSNTTSGALPSAGIIWVAGATGRVGQQVVQQAMQELERAAGNSWQGYAVRTAVNSADLPQASAGTESVAAVIYCADTAEWAREQTLTAWLQNFDLQPLVYQSIFDFAHPPANLKEIWGALDDVVMGGVSESGVRLGEGVAEFSGVVSTANSGGFASIRTRNFEPSLNLVDFDGIELRVKGDGKRYKFMLRTETRWDGIAYCYSFDTVAEQWITVRIPFSALTPVFRAKTVSDQSFNPAHVTALQMMLSKFEYDGALNPRFEAGAFQLQVSAIRAYRLGSGSKFVLVVPELETASDALEQLVQRSGIAYTVIRPTQLTDAPGGQALRVNRGTLTGAVSAADVAALSLAALSHPTAQNLSLAVTADPDAARNCVVGDWACLFRSVDTST